MPQKIAMNAIRVTNFNITTRIYVISYDLLDILFIGLLVDLVFCVSFLYIGFVWANVMLQPEAEHNQQSDYDDGISAMEICFQLIEISTDLNADPGKKIAPGNGT